MTVQDGVELHEDNKIVIVEGNYLLLYDDPEWAPLKGDFRSYITYATNLPTYPSTHFTYLTN